MTQLTPKASLPYAELTDAPNMLTFAQGLTTQLDALVPSKYSTVASRDSANPSPTQGDLAFCNDKDMLYVYSGDTASWVWSYPKVKYKASDTTRTSTTSRTDDPVLTYNIETNSVYTWEAYLIWSCASIAAGGGWVYNLTAPAGANFCYSSLNISTAGTGFNDVTMNVVADLLGSATTGSGGDAYGSSGGISQHSAGIVTTAGTSGTFALNWAQHVSSSNGTVLRAGSYMKLHKVA